jgi:hypothetical protein
MTMNMKQTLTAAALTLTLLLPAPALCADQLLWLTDVRPARKTPATEQDHAAGTASAADEVDLPQSESKRLWLRRGDDPLRASYVAADAVAGEMHLLDRRGDRLPLVPGVKTAPFHVTVTLEELGFYNAYLVERTVRFDTLRVDIAKFEVLKGTCCKKGIEQEQTRAFHDAELPLELVREHHPDEGLMTRITSGDEVVFTVLRHGRPVAGVPVTLTTQQGWRSIRESGADGRVAYTMLRDYFPSWHEFNRRHRDTFLVSASLEEETGGVYNDTAHRSVRYTTTLSGHYYPSSHDYRSYAWGLGLTLLVAAFGGTAIYLYRRRRVQPFKEVRFDEQA